MDYKENYEKWLSSDAVDEKTKDELKALAGNEKEIEDRFYRELEFGTAGMRGVIGAGMNRINVYNVRRATMGVAKYVLDEGSDAKEKGVLISYDTRNFSRIFAEETASVLCANGIKTYLFPIVHSVPEESFGIRQLGCAAGVMITASHNPKEYNGYKVYGPDGGQLPPEAADKVVAGINGCDLFTGVKTMAPEEAKQKGLLIIPDKALDEKFIETVMTQQQNPEAVTAVADTFKLIYTPFHGTGSRPIKEVLKRMGFKNVLIVKEQDTEDGNFPTVKSPNPENKEGFTIAIEMAKQNDVDVIIGTDPDCDRVGIVVRDSEGNYRTFTGNQTGALLVDYIIRSKKEKGVLPANGIVLKTIVTTELAAAIAHSYGMEIMSLLTGFKYIGEKMTEFSQKGNYTYLIGFEESYGYLVGNHARDKDGVVAAMLIAEMAAYYKTKGKSLYDALCDIYAEHGYYCENTLSYTMPGKDGMVRMAEIMKDLRANPPKNIAGMDIVKYTDYKTDTVPLPDGDTLPKADVFRCDLSDGKTYFIVRPSGTEPKIKLYIGSNAESFDAAQKNVTAVKEDAEKQLALV